MFNRTTMFVVLALSACLFTLPAPAQCVQNADGTITCPVLAPPLPPAVAGEDAQTPTDSDVSATAGLTRRELRRLGFTRLNGIGATIKLAREGSLPSTRGLTGDDLAAAKAEIQEALAVEIMGSNIQAWDDIVGDRDWTEFLTALADFFERIMPIILQLIERFGGLVHAATLTPTTSVADAVPVNSPPVMLAA